MKDKRERIWRRVETGPTPYDCSEYLEYVRADIHDALAAENARLRELIASPPIKPLVWNAEDNGDFIAVSAVGWYHIGRPASSWNLTMPCGSVPSFNDDLEAAKAAAQADYDARIRAALATPPSP